MKGFVEWRHKVILFAAVYTSVSLAQKEVFAFCECWCDFKSIHISFIQTFSTWCTWACLCHLSYSNLSSSLLKKMSSMNDIVSLAPSWAQWCPDWLIHGYPECIQKVSLLRFSFHAPPAPTPLFLLPAEWTYFGVGQQKFVSRNICYLNAFHLEKTDDVAWAIQSLVILFVFLLIASCPGFASKTNWTANSWPGLLFSVSNLGWRPDV